MSRESDYWIIRIQVAPRSEHSEGPALTERYVSMSTREEASEARERLAEAVEKLADSDTFAAWLRARATFHDYSFGNVCLIVSQCPDATQVAGYKAWQKLGRQVRKGEHGIRILAPCRVKVADTAQRADKADGYRVVGFRCVSVFD